MYSGTLPAVRKRPARIPVSVIVFDQRVRRGEMARLHQCWHRMVEGTVLQDARLLVIDGAREFHYIDECNQVKEDPAAPVQAVESQAGRQGDARSDPKRVG